MKQISRQFRFPAAWLVLMMLSLLLAPGCGSSSSDVANDSTDSSSGQLDNLSPDTGQNDAGDTDSSEDSINKDANSPADSLLQDSSTTDVAELADSVSIDSDQADQPIDGEQDTSDTNETSDVDPNGPLTVSAMSFNIRTGTADLDSDNNWLNRAPLVFSVLVNFDGDFVGMQEAWKFQLDAITKNVKKYACIGRGRGADPDFDEWSPVCYDTQRWTVDPAQNGTFWLSETPETPGSKSWNSSLPRIVTWARFIEKASGRALYVFNTHYDHKSQDARLGSSKLVAQRIADRTNSDEPVILLGDFNAGENNSAIRWLKGQTVDDLTGPVTLVDSFRVLFPDATDVGTFNGFIGTQTGSKIDYVFVEDAHSSAVLTAEIIYYNVDGRYPSDHFPVAASIRFPGLNQ